MHTPFLRLNVVFFFSVTVLFVLSLGCGAQYFVSVPTFPCTMGTPHITRFRQFYRPSPEWEHAQGQFKLDADLRPVWNWNTGQLFVYVSVEWDTPTRQNRVVIWDRIIREQKDARINEMLDLEYTINDQHQTLKGQQLRVRVHYDVMPIVGMLQTIAAPQCSTTLQMPQRYVM